MVFTNAFYGLYETLNSQDRDVLCLLLHKGQNGEDLHCAVPSNNVVILDTNDRNKFMKSLINFPTKIYPFQKK